MARGGVLARGEAASRVQDAQSTWPSQITNATTGQGISGISQAALECQAVVLSRAHLEQQLVLRWAGCRPADIPLQIFSLHRATLMFEVRSESWVT